jgi:hypothetical protein
VLTSFRAACAFVTAPKRDLIAPVYPRFRAGRVSTAIGKALWAQPITVTPGSKPPQLGPPETPPPTPNWVITANRVEKQQCYILFEPMALTADLKSAQGKVLLQDLEMECDRNGICSSVLKRARRVLSSTPQPFRVKATVRRLRS